MFFRVQLVSAGLCVLRYSCIDMSLQFLFGHMLFHFLQVQKLRTLFYFVGQLFLQLISMRLEFCLLFSLKILNQFVSLLHVVYQLFAPKCVKGFEFFVMSMLEVILFLVVSLFHLVDSPGF